MKNVLKTIVGIPVAAAGFAIAFSTPLLAIPSIAVSLYASKMARDGVVGNSIKNSFFMISKNKKINMGTKEEPKNIKVDLLSQDLMTPLNRFINARKNVSLNKNTTTELYLLEALNAFQQLETSDKYYGTRSQSATYMLLRKMVKEGYISDLEKTSAGTSKLRIEKLAFGAKTEDKYGNIIPNKEHDMYNIIFKRTNKPLDYEALKEILSASKINIEDLQYKVDKKGIYNFNGLYTKECTERKKEETKLDRQQKLERRRQKEENDLEKLNQNKNLTTIITSKDEVEKKDALIDELGVLLKTKEFDNAHNELSASISNDNKKNDYDELGVRVKKDNINNLDIERKKEEIRKMLDNQTNDDLINENSVKRM